MSNQESNQENGQPRPWSKILPWFMLVATGVLLILTINSNCGS